MSSKCNLGWAWFPLNALRGRRATLLIHAGNHGVPKGDDWETLEPSSWAGLLGQWGLIRWGWTHREDPGVWEGLGAPGPGLQRAVWGVSG